MNENFLTFVSAFGGALPAVGLLGWWLRGQFADMNDKFRHRLYTELNVLNIKFDQHVMEDRKAFEQIRMVLAAYYKQPNIFPERS